MYYNMGVAHTNLGNLDSALTVFDEAKLICTSLEDDLQLISIDQNVGLILIRKGRYSEAYTHLTQYLQDCERLGKEKSMIRGYSAIGEIYLKQQIFDSAIVYYKGSLELSRKMNSLSYRTNILHAIGTIHTSLQEYDSAQWYLERALSITEKLKLKTEKARILGALGKLHFYLENYDLATDYLQESIDIYQQASTYRFFYPTTQLIKVYLKQKEYQDAVQLAEETKRQLKDSTDMIIKRDLLIVCAKSYEAVGRYKEANEVYQEYNKIQSKIAEDNEAKKLAEAALTHKFEKEKEAMKASEKLKEEQIAYLKLKDQFRTRVAIFLSIILAILVLSSIALILFNKRLRRANKAIYDINKELAESNELKNKFFTVISHDIRAPISDMLMLLGILKEKSNDFSDRKTISFIETQENYIQNLKMTLDDITQWSASQSRVLHIEYDNMNLKELVDQIIKSYSITLGNKGISIHNLVEDDCSLISDANILSLCLRNIISNAIKFSERNGNVWVDTSKLGKYFEIIVRDEGCGISKEDIEALLSHERNVLIQNDLGSISGLGLAMTIEFLERIDGLLAMHSMEGGGTVVKIRIPIAQLTSNNKGRARKIRHIHS